MSEEVKGVEANEEDPCRDSEMASTLSDMITYSIWFFSAAALVVTSILGTLLLFLAGAMWLSAESNCVLHVCSVIVAILGCVVIAFGWRLLLSSQKKSSNFNDFKRTTKVLSAVVSISITLSTALFYVLRIVVA